MGQPRVLITDDDELTLDMLAATLAPHYEVTTATSGRQAVSLATQQDFDLILLDVDMPEMDGYATCAALKAHSHSNPVPVLFLSARISIDERLQGYRVGACDYLTKPFDVDELTAKIDLTVAQCARNRELSGQINEAINTAMATADMYGEMGVVLEMQRQLSHCQSYTEVAQVFFQALANLGFDGCLRLTGRQGVLSRTALTECSALENSILDHIEKGVGPSIQAMGENTTLRYGSVLMLIRNLPVTPSPDDFSADEIDRMGRARDNVALLAEGLMARMHALDIETEKAGLAHSRQLVDLTREALVDISAQQHANRMQLSQVFQRLNSEVEQLFVHLGLSEQQEELMSSTLRRHISEAMAVFDHSHEIDDHLANLIHRLDA
jgi:CheY-like chemotaxis protein